MAQLYIHPEYAARKLLWVQASDLFKGERAVISGREYLWPHSIEESKSDVESAKKLREARELRTRYLNLHKIVLAIWQSIFFKDSPKPDEELAKLLDPHDGASNIDGFGTSLAAFIKDQVFLSRLLYGDVHVLADAGQSLGLSKAGQTSLGFRPYLELLEPLSVIDWEIETDTNERFGKYKFIRYEYDIIEPRQTATDLIRRVKMSDSLEFDGSRYVVRRFKLGSQSAQGALPEFAESAQFEELPTIETELTEIPVASISGEAWLDGLAEESLRYHNVRSNYDNIQYNQGYDKNFIIGASDTDIPKALSEYIWGLLPEGASIQTVPPTAVDSYERQMEQALLNAMKTGLLLTRQLPADSKAVQGDDTIQAEKEALISTIQATTEDIKTLMDEACRHYAAFMGVSDFEGGVIMPEITEENVDRLLQLNISFKSELAKVPTAQKALITRVVLQIPMSEEEQVKALSEIESADFTPPDPLSGFDMFGNSNKPKEEKPQEGDTEEEEPKKEDAANEE